MFSCRNKAFEGDDAAFSRKRADNWNDSCAHSDAAVDAAPMVWPTDGTYLCVSAGGA